ncbi:MAG: hypothetical protein Q7K98_06820 [Candidatus Omnitrophota bacterium]|nr:hypothetical protein [Candidatus Omnitrophota bacterium]
MNKKIAVFLLSLACLVFTNIALADDVVFTVTLNPSVARSRASYMSASFEPVTVELRVTNMSDRIQTIQLQKSYYFTLAKVSRLTSVDPQTYLPFVAEGYLSATYGQDICYGGKCWPGYQTLEIQPHSEKVLAYGTLPANISKYNSYKGYILPGTYMLQVSCPQGLAGNTYSASSEATLFIVQR